MSLTNLQTLCKILMELQRKFLKVFILKEGNLRLKKLPKHPSITPFLQKKHRHQPRALPIL